MSSTPIKLDYAIPPGRESRFSLTRTPRGGTITLSPTPAKSTLPWAGVVLFSVLLADCFFASIGEAIAMLGASDSGSALGMTAIIVTGILSLYFLSCCARMLRPTLVRIDGAWLYLLRPSWLTGTYRRWPRHGICALEASQGQLRLILWNEGRVELLIGFSQAEYPMLSQAADWVQEWLDDPERAVS
jgi:hypothetical protein